MLKTINPVDEDQRLAALKAIELLDESKDQRLQAIVDFAVEQLDVPIALISLIYKDRHWSKAREGTEIKQCAIEKSFCDQVILQQDMLIVEDTTRDIRFHENPLVIEEPFFRFYAGAPVRAPSGKIIGVIWIADTKPRKLDQVEISIINALSHMVDDTLSGATEE